MEGIVEVVIVDRDIENLARSIFIRAEKSWAVLSV